MLKLIGAKLWAWAAIAGAVLLAIVGYQRKVIKAQNHEIKMKDKRHELGEKQDEFQKQHELEEEKANEEIQDYVVGLSVDDKFKQL